MHDHDRAHGHCALGFGNSESLSKLLLQLDILRRVARQPREFYGLGHISRYLTATGNQRGHQQAPGQVFLLPLGALLRNCMCKLSSECNKLQHVGQHLAGMQGSLVYGNGSSKQRPCISKTGPLTLRSGTSCCSLSSPP